MCFFFFNDTATTEIYTLSLHDALPISAHLGGARVRGSPLLHGADRARAAADPGGPVGGHARVARTHRRTPRLVARSEEHTSELQSRQYLVCRLLLEKKKNWTPTTSETG